MGRMANKKLAVVYITHRPINEEEICLLKYSLPNIFNYDKYIVVPDGMTIQHEFKDFIPINFNTNYFKHINRYNELLMSSIFYMQFDNYENILLLQPDCVVLKNGIDQFCGKNLFLGASFIKPKYINIIWLMKYPRIGHFLSRFKIGKKTFGYNGGFSIRNVPYFIKHAPGLKTISDKILYREDIIFSYIYFQHNKFSKEISDKFCLEEKLSDYKKLDQISSYGIHDPKKYNATLYYEILEKSKAN
jgi:hypothetical protein